MGATNKEDIEYGIPLSASFARLHQIVVSALSKSSYMPLDVFEKVKVIREEHHCVPAYCFEYNGIAPFSYQQGRRETRQELGYKRDFSGEVTHNTITTIEETIWYPQSSSVSASGSMFVSGNRKITPLIQRLYGDANNNHLVGVESLMFPSDAVSYSFDYSQLAAFSEHVVPEVNDTLRSNAIRKIENQKYVKDFSIDDGNIQKEITRVAVGLYRIVFTYGDKEFSVWINGSGTRWYCGEVPEDPALKNTLSDREKVLEEKETARKKEIAAVPVPKTRRFTVGIILSVILGVAGFLMSGGDFAVIAIFMLVMIAGIVVCIVLKRKVMKPYNTKRAEINSKHQAEIDAFQSQTTDIANQSKIATQQFNAQKKALRGIYESVSGNANAFLSVGDTSDDLDDDELSDDLDDDEL